MPAADAPTTTEDTAPPKPLLRGWFHMGAIPVVLIAGLALVTFGPTLAGRISAAVYVLTAVQLFSTSAIYHRGNWATHLRSVLQRVDHANIFLIIAGTYTPLSVLLLPKRTAIIALSIVWGGALAGLLARLLWHHAPRWFWVPLYIGLGWVAVAFIKPLAEAGGPAIVALVFAGGLAYTVGALIYALKWPDPSPKYFGFHEIFHALTITAFICHYIAVSLAIYRA
jgi:hemolysin III